MLMRMSAFGSQRVLTSLMTLGEDVKTIEMPSQHRTQAVSVFAYKYVDKNVTWIRIPESMYKSI